MISIIIPVYNHQDALERALASIQKQTYKDIEVIVVDDGSDPEIQISNFQFQIKLLRQENMGAPVARNMGMELAKGDYVIFWDADVVAEPEMLDKMVHALEQNPKASFVYSNHYFGKKKMTGRVFDIQSLQKINYIHSTSLIRRKDAVRWDESLKRFQDWDLWLTMADQGKSGVWIDEYLFRVDTGGTMSSWLPSFAYRKPWSLLPGIRERVRKYERARDIVIQKHGL
jgi:glycosyltransferase involved in cell wall biosynthesis